MTDKDDREVSRVEITYTDGSRRLWEAKAANDWVEEIDRVLSVHQCRGYGVHIPAPTYEEHPGEGDGDTLVCLTCLAERTSKPGEEQWVCNRSAPCRGDMVRKCPPEERQGDWYCERCQFDYYDTQVGVTEDGHAGCVNCKQRLV